MLKLYSNLFSSPPLQYSTGYTLFRILMIGDTNIAYKLYSVYFGSFYSFPHSYSYFHKICHPIKSYTCTFSSVWRRRV